LTFTELGAALEQAGVPLPSPDAALALETVADLAALVARQRRLGKAARESAEEEGEARPQAGRTIRSLLGSVLDAVQPAADRFPLLSSMITLAREEGLDLLDDFFARPVRGAQDEEENAPFDLPEFVVSAGRRMPPGRPVRSSQSFFRPRIHRAAPIPH